MLNDFTKTLDASFLEGETLPAFVKVADIAPIKEADQISDLGFGLIVTKMAGEKPDRLYPIYDAQRTWLSATELSKNYDGMPKLAAATAARSILGAANLFDVPVPGILQKIALAVEPTSGRYYNSLGADEPLHFDAFTGHDKEASITVDGKVFTVLNATDLVEGERWFDRNHMKLAQDQKFVLGQFLSRCREALTPDEKTAQEYSIPMWHSPEVTKVAWYNAINPEFEKNMFQRASVCTDPVVSRDFAAMAMSKSAAELMSPAALVKWAFEMDVRGKLTDSYGTWIPEAIDACLSHRKTAEEISVEEDAKKKIVVKQGALGWDDVEVPQGQLKTAIMSVCSRMLGKPLATKIAANPSVHFGELPDGVRDMVVAEAMRIR
jgi:hypothetical protein